MASNNIHRQQLFHWIGGDIEGHKGSRFQIRRKLSDAQREQYLDHLARAIRDGLWMKRPRIAEKIEAGPKGPSFEQLLPVTCFTEWTLNLSAPHSAKYGRLGLGFSKNWVMSRGGQPVTYFKSTGSDRRFAKSAADLLQYLEKLGPSAESSALLQQFRYVIAFARAVKSPAVPVEKRRLLRLTRDRPVLRYHYLTDPKYARIRSIVETSVALSPSAPAGIGKPPPSRPDLYERKFGLRLDLAEEREWRIVYHPDLLKKEVLTTGPKPPDFFVPFVPGKELFTVVLPDNRTVSMALQRDAIREELFAPDRPHVTILSFQDIGTF